MEEFWTSHRVVRSYIINPICHWQFPSPEIIVPSTAKNPGACLLICNNLNQRLVITKITVKSSQASSAFQTKVIPTIQDVMRVFHQNEVYCIGTIYPYITPKKKCEGKL